MGTRGVIGFTVEGQDKLAYNHYDSYPTGLGVKAATVIQTFTDEQINAAARRIELVKGDDKPTDEQVEAMKAFTDLTVSNRSVEDWYCLTRDLQGELAPYIDGTVNYMIDGSSFTADSLFCEWGYVLDAGRAVLEIYRGFNTSPDGVGRYANQQDEGFNTERGYFGINLIREVPFAEIRSVDAVDYMSTLEDEVNAADELKYAAEEADEKAAV